MVLSLVSALYSHHMRLSTHTSQLVIQFFITCKRLSKTVYNCIIREVGPSRSSLLDIAAPHCISGACSECSGWPAQPL